jgi:hypothetical protein
MTNSPTTPKASASPATQVRTARPADDARSVSDFERVLQQTAGRARPAGEPGGQRESAADLEPGGKTDDGRDDRRADTLLRGHRPLRERRDDERDDGRRDDAPPLLAMLAPPAHRAPEASAPGALALAASSRAFDAPPPAAAVALTPTAAGEAQRTFEVVVNDPRGVALQMQAHRPAAGAWSLSIATNLNPATLRRYSERLETRLRSKALSNEPVRIEEDDPPP